MSYLNTTFGNDVAAEFSIAGINRLAVMEKALLESVTGNSDMTVISGMTLEASAKFQEILFAEESANYTQELVKSTSSRYITQTLNFRVESDELTKAHAIILGRKYVALIKTNSGKWKIFGLSNGLNTSAATLNGTDEDSNMSFTMTSKNLGYAATVSMSDSALDALINATV